MFDKKCISNGIVSGVIAGIVLAFFIILGDMIETLGNLIHLPTKLGGMFVHFILSIIAGLIFALLLGKLVRSWWSATIIGLLFGLAVWLIVPMTLFSASLTKGSFFSKWNLAGIEENLPILIGLIVYGLALGLSYCFLKKGKLHKLKKPKI